MKRTNLGASAGVRLVGLAAVPVLVLCGACGSGDDGGSGKQDGAIADVPDAPAASASNGEGGPSTRPAGKSAFYDAQTRYVQCMRAKGGYKDFPDPKLSGYLDWAKVNAIGAQPGRNDGIKGGRNGVCVTELQAAMNAEPKRDEQKAYESMLAHAQCMRDHGVAKFANPTMSGGNAQPGGDPDPVSRSIDTESPSYKQARKACESKLLDGLDGMQ